MATLQDSLVSSTARRLRLRRRPDLTAERHRYQGRGYWIVKDPVGLNYFRFQEEEYAILQMLDGVTSLDEVKKRFEAQFPPQKITLTELQQFVGQLHKSGLIVADVAGQGHQLKKRRDERRRKELLGMLTNVLAMRFKGVDPERFLNWAHPKISFLFSRPFVVFSLLLAASALLLVLVQFDVFQSKLPTFQQFFNPRNAFLMACVLMGTKVLHELGHGMTCRHFGGECHEIGVMLLVLTPCLYCNVSDSWMLPNKWRRAAIGAAGMWVEVILASIATYVWWFTEPGLLNSVCLSTMFICSVSTVIFNGNPLLRYDGYYILSDLLEIPNLRQKATEILYQKLSWWCLGVERPEDPFLPQRKQLLFALYTVASTIYRWVVVISILFFLHEVFKPYGLTVIGDAIALVSLYGMLVHPLWKLFKYLRVPGRLAKVKKPRLYATSALVAGVLAVIGLVPLPYRVFCTLELKPRDAAWIYVQVPGQLAELLVTPGQQVQAGDPLARLVNHELDQELLRLDGEIQVTTARLAALKNRESDQARGLIPQVEQTLAGLREQWAEKEQDQARLLIRVPPGVQGTVLPPPEVEKPAAESGETLPAWWGSPLEPRNRGCFLETGKILCRVGDPTRWEADLVIDQAAIPFVHEGQRVEVRLDHLPLESIEGAIRYVSPGELKVAPRHLTQQAGGELPTTVDEQGVARPASTSYLATVHLADSDGLFRQGLRGRAKIHAEPQTLGRRLYRLAAETFNFRL